MSIIYLMLPIALALGLGFLIAFVRAARQGQYDDLVTPAHRIFLEEAHLSVVKPPHLSNHEARTDE